MKNFFSIVLSLKALFKNFHDKAQYQYDQIFKLLQIALNQINERNDIIEKQYKYHQDLIEK